MDPEEDSDLPWVEKYRPQHLDQLVAHSHIISTIQKFISERKLPHLLFYGPPGTGKTSTILAVARQMHGSHFNTMSLELNASDDRGITVVREQIKQFASTQQLVGGGIKLVILDEADAMTGPAQFALRRIIEKYTKTTRFCLVCNYVSKIIPALQSRCTRFRFTPLAFEEASRRILEISVKEQITVSDDGLAAITTLAGGDMRKCLNILQGCALTSKRITAETVHLCTGTPSPELIDALLEKLLTLNFNDNFREIQEIRLAAGLSLTDIIRELHRSILKIEFPDKMKAGLVRRLAEVEVRLSVGSNEKLQQAAMIGAFLEARQIGGSA